MPERFTIPQLVEHAGRAIGKVDARGRRGAEKVTHEEIEAMAALLAVLGIAAIPPSTPPSTGDKR